MTVRAFTAEQESDILRMRSEGYPLKDIVALFGRRNSVCSLLKREGVTVKRGGSVKRFVPPEERDSIITLWTAGDSVGRIVKKTGSSREIVHRVLEEAGIEVVPRRNAPGGSDHWNWIGGRVLTARGYVGIALDVDDPFKDMSNGQYALEHRVVVARHLGRPLRADETVHHINGDRTDNRLENLQLRQGQHGVGVKYSCNDCGSHNVTPVAI